MNDKAILLLRADASPQIGTGHVMRCLALAQAWRERGGIPVFAAATLGSALAKRLAKEELELVSLAASPGSAEDATQTAMLARARNACWAVVDGYQFNDAYQKVIKQSDLRLLFVDDNGHAKHYCADIILNQNFHATEALYANRAPYTRLLVGVSYALLRREFWSCRDRPREFPGQSRRLLVTLGGSDPDNVTLTVVKAVTMLALPDLKVRIVVGPANSNLASIREGIEGTNDSFELFTDVEDMHALMSWADASVNAGGTTCWELLAMGIPMVVIIVADNQRKIAESLAENGIACCVGWHGELTPTDLARKLGELLESSALRSQMISRGRRLVDGLGARRVVDQLWKV